MIALAISCGIVGFVYGGCVWIRDNVFPAPDPIELRHRIEKAGAWPVMHRIAEQVLDGQKPCVDEAGDRALQAAGIKTWFPWIKTGDKTDAVYFYSGGADNHYGVIVCRKGDTAANESRHRLFRYSQKWGDGIWYVADISPRTPRVVGVPLPRE